MEAFWDRYHHPLKMRKRGERKWLVWGHSEKGDGQQSNLGENSADSLRQSIHPLLLCSICIALYLFCMLHVSRVHESGGVWGQLVRVCYPLLPCGSRGTTLYPQIHLDGPTSFSSKHLSKCKRYWLDSTPKLASKRFHNRTHPTSSETQKQSMLNLCCMNFTCT